MQLIHAQSLEKAKKILFITHLAIGDFTYLQNFFSAFARAYPHIQIDIWIDEVRRTSEPAKWEFLKKYSLYDWAEYCPFFRKVYRRTYSPDLLQESIVEARNEQYPLIVSLATLRPHIYARLAREVGPNAFTVGIRGKSRWYAPWDITAYKRLDATFVPFKTPKTGYHITDVYADWFLQLSGLNVSTEDRLPFVHIPDEWTDYAAQQLQDWGITSERVRQGDKIVFINAFAKTKKRCWPLKNVAELVIAMRALPQWATTHFIINAVPQELKNVKMVFNEYKLNNTYVFSANENFFQLPAILKRCDLIISVETAVMHLANAVHVPVIALMRQKNPEWVPIDHDNSTVVMTDRRREWVDAIPVARIVDVLKK
ncbi:glycosyltransferase family 9 protein [Undibacterium sp. RuRC25W]|uniref:glycosyltransferase family 9 protein n=1 Tax=Undibacterium sp. RuRC25W TaxID=3413047 RepID=UPI003BF05F8B